MIEIGDKVVCVINGEWKMNGCTAPNGCPVYGEICVVAGFSICPKRGSLGFKITGRPIFRSSGGEGGFDARRFRKLDELKQSVLVPVHYGDYK